MIVDPTILFYLILGIAVLVLIILVWLIALWGRLNIFTRGKKGTSLEQVIKQTIDTTEELKRLQIETAKSIQGIDERVGTALRGVGTVRFNPFRESSGSQSFATALVDENGDGVIISTLYSREKTSIFAKPLKAQKSKYELTQEEKKAIKKALENL